MSWNRAARDPNLPPSQEEMQRPVTGPAVLFICAVVIAGMTCILYLWQQSRIVAGRQDIVQYDATITALLQQHDDLVAQRDNLASVTNIVTHATAYHMTRSDNWQGKLLALAPVPQTTTLAQRAASAQPAVILPATNAAIESWWQGAWDSLYIMLQH